MLPPVLMPDQRAFGGARQQSLDGDGAHSYLWVGRVVHVDTETMVCSVRLETGNGERHDVPLPAPGGAGPRSWAGTILEPGSKVILGWKRFDQRSFVPYIVEVLSVGTFSARQYEPFSTVDPDDAAEALAQDPGLADDPRLNLGVTRLKARKGYPGDFIASSSSGSDFILDRDVYLTNRAGVELRLRDADQTTVLQTTNEFTSNAAGFYRRGLVKRNGFNLLPDLLTSGEPIPGFVGDVDVQEFFDTSMPETGPYLVEKVPVGSPAHAKLLEFGLIREDGSPTFPNDPAAPFYPFVVTPDGQRVSYVTDGEPEFSFSESDQAFVEDRMELRHTYDGVPAVTEEGDGVQIDQARSNEVLITRVYGTVVGNDAYSESGRSTYKQVLKMKLFDSEDDGSPSAGPRFEPVDTLTGVTEAHTKALAHLLQVNNPTTGVPAYCFGIQKDGRTFLHVAKSKSGTVQDRGKSLDANILGMIKAIVGQDEGSGTSLDAAFQGGVKLQIGSFKNPEDDPEVTPEAVSVDVRFKGKVRTYFDGPQGRDTVLNGSDFRSVSGSCLDVVGGSSVRNVGGVDATEAFSISHNAGFGGYKFKSAGDVDQTTFGKTTRSHALIRISTFLLGDVKLNLAGVDSTTMLSGVVTRTVVAGGIADTVTAGNIALTAVTGNIAMSVATGNIAMSAAAGNVAVSSGAGATTVAGGVSTTVGSATLAQVVAPIVKLGASVVGGVVAGVPGPAGPHLDFLTGLPIFGMPTVTVGP
jgi:hypothetical protein